MEAEIAGLLAPYVDWTVQVEDDLEEIVIGRLLSVNEAPVAIRDRRDWLIKTIPVATIRQVSIPEGPHGKWRTAALTIVILTAVAARNGGAVHRAIRSAHHLRAPERAMDGHRATPRRSRDRGLAARGQPRTAMREAQLRLGPSVRFIAIILLLVLTLKLCWFFAEGA